MNINLASPPSSCFHLSLFYIPELSYSVDLPKYLGHPSREGRNHPLKPKAFPSTEPTLPCRSGLNNYTTATTPVFGQLPPLHPLTTHFRPTTASVPHLPPVFDHLPPLYPTYHPFSTNYHLCTPLITCCQPSTTFVPQLAPIFTSQHLSLASEWQQLPPGGHFIY